MKALQAASNHCLQMQLVLSATSGQDLRNILLATLALGALFGNAHCCGALKGDKALQACRSLRGCPCLPALLCYGLPWLLCGPSYWLRIFAERHLETLAGLPVKCISTVYVNRFGNQQLMKVQACGRTSQYCYCFLLSMQESRANGMLILGAPVLTPVAVLLHPHCCAL